GGRGQWFATGEHLDQRQRAPRRIAHGQRRGLATVRRDHAHVIASTPRPAGKPHRPRLHGAPGPAARAARDLSEKSWMKLLDETCVSYRDRCIIRAVPGPSQAKHLGFLTRTNPMVRLKLKLSEPPKPPERGVKAATFHLLLGTAMDIIRES